MSQFLTTYQVLFIFLDELLVHSFHRKKGAWIDPPRALMDLGRGALA